MTGVILGSQTPTHRLAPPYELTLGPRASALARLTGRQPHPWQDAYWADQLGITRTGGWSAPTGEIELSRRNGKTFALQIIAMVFMMILRAKSVVWTTHRGDSALQAFKEMSDLIELVPEWTAELERRPIRTNGKEGFDFRYGGQMRFKTRVDDGGRSLFADLVILDEDQALMPEVEAGLTPINETSHMAMTLYAGSAGTQKSIVKGRLIQQITDGAPGLCGYRWAASEDDDPSDPLVIARVNPAVGRTLTLDRLIRRQATMNPVFFNREWLGMGDYPRDDGAEWVIPQPSYEASIDRASSAVSPLVFVPEVAHDRQTASISVAGWRADGRKHVEVVKRGVGTRWIVPHVARLTRRHPTMGVAADFKGPTGSLEGTFADAGIDVTRMTAVDLTQAYGGLYDAWMTGSPSIRHRGPDILAQALAVASTRSVGGATTWSRMSAGQVHPLLGVTWAAHMLDVFTRRPPKLQPPAPRRADPDPNSVSRGPLTADLAAARF